MNEYILILLRAFCIFIVLMIIIRLLGKREVGELSVFDLAIILIISDIGAMGIDEKKLFLPAICCLVLLLILQKSFSFLLLKFSSLRSFIDGSPRILIYKGEILFNNLKKEAYTIDDLLNQIHQEGILDISEVNLAILETSGTLAVFSKKRYKEIVDKHTPKENVIKNALVAFIVGGILGSLSELLLRGYMMWFDLPRKESGVMVILTLITIASVLTACGVFDVLVSKVKAALIIPITGFAHSMTSAALEYKHEGLVLGIGSNIFKLAGTVILYGVVAVYFFGLIRLLVMGG